MEFNRERIVFPTNDAKHKAVNLDKDFAIYKN